MASTFVHLNVHTEFSLVDGIVRTDALLDRLKKTKMPAVALTDQSNLFGMVKFYQAALEQGIKPIIGVDMWLFHQELCSKLLLLCQNEEGYHHLTKLITKTYLEGLHKGIPRASLDWVKDHSTGIIALSGAQLGWVGHHLVNHQPSEAEKALDTLASIFPDRFYLELQCCHRPQEQEYIESCLRLSERHQIPIVATNAVRFLDSEDFEAHEARVCIHEGTTLSDERRVRQTTREQYLKTPAQMQALFKHLPEAITNSLEIAKRCNLILELGKFHLPNFPVPGALSVEAFFTQQAQIGLNNRLFVLCNSDSERVSVIREPYDIRLDFELSIIKKMGFSGYFLIVADFIAWSKTHDIPVGPGRGSGAGSLVAYSLGITDLDPLIHQLLFERFLNPERVSMPDFDVDFCMEGRDRVIDYVIKKYGKDNVCQIITYGRMAAKAVIRDVGRVLGYPYGFVDKIAKLIPFELGITLDKAMLQEPLLKQRYQDEEDVRSLINLAKKLEGITRNAGKHAGGLVIAPYPSILTDYTPLYCCDENDAPVTQFDKDDIEAVGLVKFDFLGLRTLTLIKWALENIEKSTGNKIDINRIPLDDAPTYKLLQAHATTAVFQLESRGMRDLVKRLKPDRFEEIVALVALFRPGPLQSGMVDDFINRKHGLAKIEYPHPLLEPILNTTYGIVLYQEQVMKIAQVLSGYTLGQADLLRRAMGKKKPEEMAKQRDRFLQGAKANGVTHAIASSIFDTIEKFSGYAFNLSHSAAYALLAYQTAWLKTHYPAEFMAAVLSSDMDNTDKVMVFIEECHRLRLTLIPPNINRSEYHFTVENNQVIYGLGAIKGVGKAAIESILGERQRGGSFRTLFELCERVDGRKMNKRVLEALIRSGALDQLGAHRASLMASLERARELADKKSQNQEQGQVDLFENLIDPSSEVFSQYLPTPSWSSQTQLLYEKEALGIYLSGHPITQYEVELSQLVTAPLSEVANCLQSTVTIGGLLTNLRTLLNKKGKKMAFISLEDRGGRAEVALFSDLYDSVRELLQTDQLLIVKGDLRQSEFNELPQLKATTIMTLDQARQQVKQLVIRLEDLSKGQEWLHQLKEILMPNRPGNCLIYIEYSQEGKWKRIALGPEWQVTLTQGLLEQLNALCKADQISVCY